MKATFTALALLACAAAHAEPMDARGAGPEAEIKRFAHACFSALHAEHWLDNAKCYNPEQLSEFQRLYLERTAELAPGVVPQEFVAFYKGDITLDRLKAVEPAEFFAAFNGGWNALLAPRGCENGDASFEVTEVATAGQNTYQVAGTTKARRTCAGKAEDMSKPEAIMVQLQNGKPSISLPKRTFDLLRARR